MVISVDYNYSRITIADHEINGEIISLWLEDRQDFKNTLDECLRLDISLKDFAKTIIAENMNSYEGSQVHPTKKYVYRSRIEISKPLNWYNCDATTTEQQWAREALLKRILTQLVESEVNLCRF